MKKSWLGLIILSFQITCLAQLTTDFHSTHERRSVITAIAPNTSITNQRMVIDLDEYDPVEREYLVDLETKIPLSIDLLTYSGKNKGILMGIAKVGHLTSFFLLNKGIVRYEIVLTDQSASFEIVGYSNYKGREELLVYCWSDEVLSYFTVVFNDKNSAVQFDFDDVGIVRKEKDE